MLRNRSGVCKGFGSMDSGQGERRGAEGSAAWTANGEGELYGVQHRGQWSGRTGGVRGSAPWIANGNGGAASWAANRGTGEVLTVQHHRQRAGNGSCTWYSIVDSGQGREEYGVQHRGQWIEDRRDAEGLQHRGQRASGMCTGWDVSMERGEGDGRGADGSAP